MSAIHPEPAEKDCVWRCAQCGELIWAGRDEFGDPTPWWHVNGPRPHDHPATPHDIPPAVLVRGTS